MRRLFLAGIVFVFLAGGPAMAAGEDCKKQIDDLNRDWAATGLPAPDKPGQTRVAGKKGHEHTGAEVTYMRNQRMKAAHLCQEGNEHEAMLRMDVIRAWLKLPEVQHPAEHKSSGKN